MPFTKSQPEDLSEIRDLAYGWGKVVTPRAYGEKGPGLDLDFDSIESLAVEIGRAVRQATIEEVLRIQFQRLGDHQPCPQCSRACPVTKAPRTIQVRGATVLYDEPVCRCSACRRDFSPLRPSLRLDSHDFSPTILGKIARASARAGSFDAAAESLADEAEITNSGRQLGRIAHEIGAELKHHREQLVVDDFRNFRGKPEVPVVPWLAVASVDGGRLRTRAEAPAQGSGVHDAAWREDKVANLLTMTTKNHDQDPHTELPRCFTKKREVVKLVQGISGHGALADVIEAPADEPPGLTVFEPEPEQPEPRWQPEPLVRTCQATLESSDEFGPMVAAEAHRRNFFAAQSRVYLGDDGAWIWTLHRTYFPTFEPIVDFVHELTYAYSSAKAVGGSATAVWERYLDWATACWQGRVANVLD